MKKSLLKSTLNSLGLMSFLKNVRKSFNWEYNYILNGKKVKGLKIYSAKTENSELWMGQLLEVLLRLKDGVFIDVGVNIGQTLMQVKSLDVNRKYIGFEPNPSCNMIVEELIRVNRFSDIKLIPVGIFTEDTLLELDLYHDDITNSGGSIVKDYWAFNEIKPHRKIMVPLMCIETIKKVVSLENIDIIKIDVEGAEWEVLLSLKDTIAKNKPYIVIEVLSAYSTENKIRIERQESILSLLNSLEYSLFRIIEDDKANLKGIQKIDFFDPYFNKNLCNYLMIHKSEESSITKKIQPIEL